MALLLAGCNRSNEGVLPAIATSSQPEGLWDEDGTADGYKKSIQHYETVLQKNPSDLTALTEISYSYTKLAWLQRLNVQYDLWKWPALKVEDKEMGSNLTHAWEFLGLAKNIDSKKDIVLAAEAILQRANGHLAEAISLAQQAFQPKSKVSSPRILEAYEVTQFDQDQIRDLYKQALELAPKNAYYWWQFGVHEKNDKTKQAAYERAVALAPAFAMARTDRDLSKWVWFRLKDMNQLTEARAVPASYVSYYKSLTIFDLIGWAWMVLLYLIAIRSRTRVLWVFLMLYPCLRLAVLLLPGIGDRYMLIEKGGEALSAVIYFLGVVVFWDLMRAWFGPNSNDSLFGLIRCLSRGMLAAWRRLFKIPVDRSTADLTYLLVLGELWILNYAVQQIFLRLTHGFV